MNIPDNIPQIIKEASASPLGILSLVCIATGLLAWGLFKKAPLKLRFRAFVGCLLVFAASAFGAIAIRYNPSKGDIESSQVLATTNPPTAVLHEPMSGASATNLPMAAGKRFNVAFTTSGRPDGGTDANVYLIIYGDQHVSKKYEFKGKGKTFEKGTTQVFTISASPPLGKINSIEVGHDSAGENAEWLLDKVKIVDLTSKVSYEFPCNRWVGEKGKRVPASVSLKPQ